MSCCVSRSGALSWFRRAYGTRVRDVICVPGVETPGYCQRSLTGPFQGQPPGFLIAMNFGRGQDLHGSRGLRKNADLRFHVPSAEADSAVRLIAFPALTCRAIECRRCATGVGTLREVCTRLGMRKSHRLRCERVRDLICVPGVETPDYCQWSLTGPLRMRSAFSALRNMCVSSENYLDPEARKERT